VQTKNAKAATTYLLEIPDLLKVVEAWDVRVRAKLSPDVLWYAKLGRDGLELAERMVGHVGRRELVARGLARLCARANIDYHSPHKLRHGHAVYAIGNATTIADFEAVSQNLMHASLGITDRVYGVLQGEDVQTRIRSLRIGDQITWAISRLRVARFRGDCLIADPKRGDILSLTSPLPQRVYRSLIIQSLSIEDLLQPFFHP
jgi:hypothetical protein